MDVAFNITRRCNKSCDYCYLNLTGENLSLKDIKKIMTSVKVNTVTLTGGEPLVHPQIEEILSFISGAGHHIHLMTNGILLKGRTIEFIKEAKAELFITYNIPNNEILSNLQEFNKYKQGININHVLTYESLSFFDKVCTDVCFAKNIILLYPTNVGGNNVKMYNPEEWFPLLREAIEISSKYGIKTYFEQAFAKKDSMLGKNPPCATGEDIFIDVDGISYACCLQVNKTNGCREIKPIKHHASRCDFLKYNKLPHDSEYIRICPIAITDFYDGSFIFPSYLEEV